MKQFLLTIVAIGASGIARADQAAEMKRLIEAFAKADQQQERAPVELQIKEWKVGSEEFRSWSEEPKEKTNKRGEELLCRGRFNRIGSGSGRSSVHLEGISS